MAQLKIDNRLETIVNNIDKVLREDDPFDEKLIQLITDYARLMMQKSGQVAREFTWGSKDEMRRIAKEIKKLYNTPGELVATITTSALSVIGGGVGVYGAGGGETARSLSQGLSAMGQGSSGLSSIPKNKVEAEKEYSRHLKDMMRQQFEQENEQLRKDERKTDEVLNKVREADKARHETTGMLLNR